jgi:citrate synthase
MAKTASLKLDEKEYPLPVVEGTEGERAIDTRSLRVTTGHIAFDQGYGNTGSCESKITFLDGDNGILRHRGYPIEQLAQHSDFVETAYLVIYGELPTPNQRKEFGLLLRKNAAVETQMQKILEGFPTSASPMAMLSALVSALPAYHADLAANNFEKDLQSFDLAGGRGDFEDPDVRGDDLPLPEGAAVHLPEAGAAVLRQLPAHDVFRAVQGLHRDAGGGERR